MEKDKLVTTLKTSDMMLCHCQMGHLGEKNLQGLCTKKNFHEIDDLKDFNVFCEALLRPGFSPLEIQRVKSQHRLLGLAFRVFPRVSTCVSQRLVPVKDRYRTGVWLFLFQR